MLVTIAFFACIWAADFKKTKGSVRERAVFLTLIAVSLTLALLISSGVMHGSVIDFLEYIMNAMHLHYRSA